ncbi:MAG: dihydrofolate reductase [Bacillota bacterium]|nr:dihydrofolate reductase [Bacillota bacterium]
MISYIVAMDENRVIGKENQLPWRLPEDLKFFKRVTMGHPVAMGRKTFESIGRKLPGRENMIITRNREFQCEDCTIFYSVQDFVEDSKRRNEEVFVIGGAEIFKESFPFVDRLYITHIHERFSGDTFFPEFNIQEWMLQSCEKGPKNEQNPFDYEFCIYNKR